MSTAVYEEEQSVVPPPGADPTSLDAYRARYQELEALLEYAASSGLLQPPAMAEKVKALKWVALSTEAQPVTAEQLCTEEARLEQLYASFVRMVEPVTVDTLRATSSNPRDFIQRPWWSAWLLGSSCAGRNFFRRIFWVSVALVALLVTKQLMDDLGFAQSKDWLYYLLDTLEPFAYGALGSLMYLYKTLTRRFIDRSLDPDKLVTDWVRIFMGAMAGGMMVLLFGATADDAATKAGMELTGGAIGFLSGYSVEFFYRTLDRIIAAILPGKSTDEEVGRQNGAQRQQESLVKLLSQTENEEDKAAIRKLLEKT